MKKHFGLWGQYLFWSLLAMLSTTTSCTWPDRDEQAPTYVLVDSFETTLTFDQGTESSNFSDVWFTAGNTSLGAYPLPARIPVLEGGKTPLSFTAGVLENGIGATRLPYPFFLPFLDTPTLVPLGQVKVTPILKYRPNTKLALVEGFESAIYGLEPIPGNQGVFTRTTQSSEVFEGLASLRVDLDTMAKTAFLVFKDSRTLPRNKAVWIETNYKSDIATEVGVFLVLPSGVVQVPIAGFNPSEDWKKIYFNLTETVNDYPTVLSVRPYFKATKELGQDATILLDNVKWLYLE